MDAHATHSPFCPVCQRTVPQSPHKSLMRGLLTCQHCRESLVVTWSGHYVRDPFGTPPPASGGCDDVARTLRRKSHPLARLMRDLGLQQPPSVVILISTVLLLGMTCWLLKPTPSPKPVPSENPPQTALESAP